MKIPKIETGVKLTDIIYGGQAIGSLKSGKKVFAWGGIPGEVVDILLTKNKSSHAEGLVSQVVQPSPERIEPRDSDSYLSTSPWQIMTFESEQKYKASLIKEAFKLQHIDIDEPEIVTNSQMFEYRNKMEYSFWWDEETNRVSIALFRRGSHGKIKIESSSLASQPITRAANQMIMLVNNKQIDSRQLKTLLLRSTEAGEVVMQLYVKDDNFAVFTEEDFDLLGVMGLEIIYSNPKSPASVITKRLKAYGNLILKDNLLGVPFQYVAEGFFQINLPVYELVLNEMKKYIDQNLPTVDMYSGVGTIGLTIGSNDLTMVETNQAAVSEMQRNIAHLNRHKARAVLSDSEKSLEDIKPNINLVLDPPRAGCHKDLIQKILASKPKNIIYLSCNPVTQARDISLLLDTYEISNIKGFNFFPRTPHIENLTVLTLKN